MQSRVVSPVYSAIVLKCVGLVCGARATYAWRHTLMGGAVITWLQIQYPVLEIIILQLKASTDTRSVPAG